MVILEVLSALKKVIVKYFTETLAFISRNYVVKKSERSQIIKKDKLLRLHSFNFVLE